MCEGCRELLDKMPEGVLDALHKHSFELQNLLDKLDKDIGHSMVKIDTVNEPTSEQLVEQTMVRKLIIGAMLMSFQTNCLPLNKRPDDEIQLIQMIMTATHDGCTYGHAYRCTMAENQKKGMH